MTAKSGSTEAKTDMALTAEQFAQLHARLDECELAVMDGLPDVPELRNLRLMFGSQFDALRSINQAQQSLAELLAERDKQLAERERQLNCKQGE